MRSVMTRAATLAFLLSIVPAAAGFLPAAADFAAPPPGPEGQEPPEGGISLSVIPGAEEVDFGEGFPLTVVRAWERTLVPEAWDEGRLSPLKVQLLETERREHDRYVEETRRYRCFAFHLGEITVPVVVFKADPVDGGSQRVAASEAFAIRVHGLLDPDDPGPAELPGTMLPDPSGRRLWPAGVVLALAVMTLLWYMGLRARRRRADEAPPAQADPPHLRTLARLQRLRERRPASAREMDAFHVEASAILREYLSERFAVAALSRTTEELAGALPAVSGFDGSHRAAIGDLLAHCDLVKFGRHAPAAPDRERLLDGAERFVRETGTCDARGREAPAGRGEP